MKSKYYGKSLGPSTSIPSNTNVKSENTLKKKLENNAYRSAYVFVVMVYATLLDRHLLNHF